LPASVELVRIELERVPQVWPHARELIRSAIERTGLSRFADMEDAVLAGRHVLWIAWDGSAGAIAAAATTEIKDGVCVLVALGGRDRWRWLQHLERLEQYARDNSCSTLRIFGRKGWARVLDGYQVKYVILERAL
jgi:hypothetical protein